MFTGNGKGNYLFTPSVPALPGSTYSFKAFVNTLGETAGEFGFYIDEYDTNGNWISGQWLGAVWLPTVSYFTATYTPSSNAVNSFKIQTYFSGNSSGKVYADNFELYNLTTDQGTVTPTPIPTATATPAPTATATPSPIPTATMTPTPTVQVTPSVTPTVTLTPTPTASQSANLVTNGSFEQISGDFAAGWQKDGANFVVDSSSKGNNGANAIHLLPGNTTEQHLFSNQITTVS